MADSEAQYCKVPEDGVDAPRITSSRAFKVGIALIGGSCLVVLSMMAISAYGPTSSVAESTDLFGMRASLRAIGNPAPMAGVQGVRQMLAGLPGPSPWKEMAMAGFDDISQWEGRCERDVSMCSHSKVQQVYMSLDIAGQAQMDAAKGALIEKAQDLKAGQTAPMGYFDPLGFSKGASKSKILYYREAEIKHGRVCMLASLGYIFGELWHPFFGGRLTMESYKIALPEVYETVGMGTFWAALFVALAIPEATYSLPTLKGFGEVKEDRVPGDFGFDPLGLKNSGFCGTSFIDMQNKEINNGRLAMLAWFGMIGQEILTGKPLLFNLLKS